MVRNQRDLTDISKLFAQVVSKSPFGDMTYYPLLPLFVYIVIAFDKNQEKDVCIPWFKLRKRSCSELLSVL